MHRMGQDVDFGLAPGRVVAIHPDIAVAVIIGQVCHLRLPVLHFYAFQRHCPITMPDVNQMRRYEADLKMRLSVSACLSVRDEERS